MSFTAVVCYIMDKFMTDANVGGNWMETFVYVNDVVVVADNAVALQNIVDV